MTGKGVSATQRGKQYEDLALDFLLDQGLQLVTRNYRCRWGELDLLMQEHNTLIIVEVRYRKNARYGSAVESITANKRARIVAATKHYIMTYKINQSIRFDVLAITGDIPPEWIKSAF
ncbi:MAG: YraN family protein [Gammaproteobacteria bacterium]|jgi:putative endonuclease|nr:YraN family protein [Gammaproteobacteria bacterium]MBT5223087.1 YraN family protein [Gammaproteobacteria bacterium]MBT5826252.1 YraN family protein [Gammaproteobacteria bacterium]MBT5967402.1 YraN family protein [Gammaproteobacteria bacterium]MBT6420545.1 YraN family protein [Gammaproteobacteria bacterium]